MRILFFGDVVGRSGVKALSFFLPLLKEREKADFVIVNGENSSYDGRGMGRDEYMEIYGAGADCVTLGNHFDRKREILPFLDSESDIVRPVNVPGVGSGRGSRTFMVGHTRIRVTNLMGTALMDREYENPYPYFEGIMEESDEHIHIVDFHGESSSEKATFAFYADGRVSAVIGTHTHVQTADERILPRGTAFITDVGMNGYGDGIIGYDEDTSVQKFVLGEKTGIIPGEGNRLMCNALLMDIDGETGKCTYVKRIREFKEVNDG